jgi:hypothetical protein
MSDPSDKPEKIEFPDIRGWEEFWYSTEPLFNDQVYIERKVLINPRSQYELEIACLTEITGIGSIMRAWIRQLGPEKNTQIAYYFLELEDKTWVAGKTETPYVPNISLKGEGKDRRIVVEVTLETEDGIKTRRVEAPLKGA